jgi:hypothetical protein
MIYVLFLFYRYYSKGATKDIPYPKSVFAFLGTVLLTIVNILMVLIPDQFRQGNIYYLENPKPARFAVGLVMAGIIYAIFHFVLPENKIRAVKERPNTSRDGWILVGYIVFSLGLFVLLTLYRL